MSKAERDWGRGSIRYRRGAFWAAIGGMALAGTAGCGQNQMETGFSDQCKTQVQFLSPPGAAVTVRGCSTRTHEIAQDGPFGHRLENSPEELCVFNLAPGQYEFKYTTADGLPGVSVYGELDVKKAKTHEGQMLQRQSFIPISVPSEHYRKVEVAGDEIFPYRGEALRNAIDEQDLQRLKQGDVVEKVFFVADLEKAEKVLDKVEQRIVVCERKIEYADARFRLAYMDFRMDVGDPSANFWGTDKNFIQWENERKELEQELSRLELKQKRTKALLKGDHVLVRRGMLVVATEELVKPHRDVVDASEEVGEVLCVMRVGGRHMQWGDPRREMAVTER